MWREEGEERRKREIQKSAEDSLESSAEYWLEHGVRKLLDSRETTTQRSRGNKPWTSHEAKTSLFPLARMANLI